MLPVIVLSGFLGSGKTRLLSNLLSQLQDKKVALIVNDMSEFNVDAELVRHLRLEQTQASLVEMSNGCNAEQPKAAREILDLPRRPDFSGAPN